MGIEYVREQQRLCAKRWRKDKNKGAWDGLCDWLMEECLILQTPPPPKEIEGGGVEGKKREHHEYT